VERLTRSAAESANYCMQHDVCRSGSDRRGQVFGTWSVANEGCGGSGYEIASPSWVDESRVALAPDWSLFSSCVWMPTNVEKAKSGLLVEVLQLTTGEWAWWLTGEYSGTDAEMQTMQRSSWRRMSASTDRSWYGCPDGELKRHLWQSRVDS